MESLRVINKATKKLVGYVVGKTSPEHALVLNLGNKTWTLPITEETNKLYTVERVQKWGVK